MLGQNFKASQAVHDSDDITTEKFWSKVNSMISRTPQVFNFVPNVILQTLKETQNFLVGSWLLKVFYISMLTSHLSGNDFGQVAKESFNYRPIQNYFV